MKKKGILGFLTLISVLIISGCSEGVETKNDNKNFTSQESLKNESKNEIITVLTLEEKYEEIFGKYSEQIKEKSNLYLKEYKEKTKSKNLDFEKLSDMKNNQILQLSEILNSGLSEMEELLMKDENKAKLYHEEWTTKLTNIFEDESKRITDIYDLKTN